MRTTLELKGETRSIGSENAKFEAFMPKGQGVKILLGANSKENLFFLDE